MAVVIPLSGVALAYVEREFEGFVDRGTGQVVDGGVTRTLWIGQEFGDEPLQVKVSGEKALALPKLARGTAVEVQASMFAKGNRITYRLESIRVPTAARAA